MKISMFSRVNTVERMTDAHPSWLIAECIAGNEDAIEMFVRQHESGVFRLALSIVGDQAEAYEIAQETFIAALRSLPSYQDRQAGKSLKAWLYMIALNHSRSRLRKRKVTERLKATLTTIFHIESQKQSSPEETVLLNEREATIWNALQELDERFRIVVVLRYFHELPVAEISEILSIHEGTVHSRLHTARERLRVSLGPLFGE